MSKQNHLIDPTFFFDAIDEFAFTYRLYNCAGKTLDDYGKTVVQYHHTTISGSLQPASKSVSQQTTGNITSLQCDFYCKALYQIDIGDVLEYKNNFLRVISVNDYDEFGVRSCHLEMIQLSAYQDLAKYIKYLKGCETI